MSLGKVVITTNLNTLSEIVGNDRGILVEPNNPSVLAQAVLHIMDHPEQSAGFAKNAQRFVTALDDWDQVTLHFEGLLKRALNGGC
jgi:glycosyltransferase involved in cell wall biosynthesis